ncbi:hypothetical protein DAEQUDRAFT_764296 [Daedalea quercina L-15889]|uniref:Uncharacterized protein n=1 Tax=Daedalea quercina L-15889 TaxID=1314783 RepID=A0A165RGB9_9APHY|nr:hypothetical protein DAEQUDRAFT_764296 [Daedalea quercina L-15889]
MKVNEKGKTVKAKKISFWKHVDAELKKVHLASIADGANKKTCQEKQTIFFAALLDADIQAYTQVGTEYYGCVYRDGGTLTANQCIGEEAAGEFVVDNSRTLVTDEPDE